MNSPTYAPFDDKPPVFFDRTGLKPSVEIAGVSHWYGESDGKKQVLFGNNLSLYEGEIVIMTGPSGSGKTTLLTLIGALRSLQAGSLKIMGRELRGLSPTDQVLVRRNIGFIFQAHNLFESLTAYQNVKLATELHQYGSEEQHRRTVDILHQLGLAERLTHTPARLSGGQRQRVAIGRALVNKPKLILADEPTAALDKETGRQVVDLLKRLAETEGATILIVTHDNRILDVADRIVNMVDGYVVSDVVIANHETICKILRKCSVFAKSSPTLLANIAGKVLQEKYARGVEVIHQGEEGDKFYIVISGKLEVEIEEKGEKHIVAQLQAGDFFGELALLHNQPRKATVRVAEDVLLLTLNKTQFLEVVNSSPSFEEQLKRVYFSR